MHIWYFKSSHLQNKFRTPFLFTISLTSLTYCTQCLVKKYIELCPSRWSFNPEKYPCQYKVFYYPKIIKFMRQFLWKGETFGKNCSSFGSNEDSIFYFHPAQLPDAFLMTLARCLQRRIFDWGFKMWIMIFFVFY